MNASDIEHRSTVDVPEVIRIVESRALGRWVLAELLTDSKTSFEVTYAPDITGEEWEALRKELPPDCRVLNTETVGGHLLGIPMATTAYIA
jgi:hypothetical protein